MSTSSRNQVTQILAGLGADDAQGASRLLPLVYEELRELAHRRMAKESPGLTIQATALVHEAYLRLVGDENLRWENRGHFFAAAAEAMRRILVERARKYRGLKHGGGRNRVSLEPDSLPGNDDPTADILPLDEALTRLEAKDKLRSDVVKLRYFAGLTIEQTAESLGISTATVERYWTFARAWLRTEMSGDRHGGQEARAPDQERD